MGPFEMVVAIVAIGALSSVLRAKYGHKNRGRGEAETGLSGRDAELLRAELRTLKERVATLERIATDGSSNLDREIEALRSKETERLDR